MQGHLSAQHALGFHYATGDGVEASDAEAIKWFQLAANGGHAAAQAGMGIILSRRNVILSRRNGVPEDPVEAFKWLTLAADQGDDNAQRAIVKVKSRLTPEQIAEAERRARAFVPATAAEAGQ
jgi:TPR repeat protein